jgi:hypothetical protein
MPQVEEVVMDRAKSLTPEQGQQLEPCCGIGSSVQSKKLEGSCLFFMSFPGRFSKSSQWDLKDLVFDLYLNP